MSKAFPSVDEVITWLRDQDMPAMAETVRCLRTNYESTRSASEQAVAALNEMRQRYEPAWRPPDHVARGRSSD